MKQGARVFHNEQWAVIYPNESRLAYMNQDIREVFEVFVVRALGKSTK